VRGIGRRKGRGSGLSGEGRFWDFSCMGTVLFLIINKVPLPLLES